jgi:hypothetical protein
VGADVEDRGARRLTVAAREPAGRHAHRNLAITGLDGVRREISVTAFPLLSSATELVGMFAIFWRLEEGVSG